MIHVINLDNGINIIHLDIEEDFVIAFQNEIFTVDNTTYHGISVFSVRLIIKDNLSHYKVTGYNIENEKIFSRIIDDSIESIVAIQCNDGKQVYLSTNKNKRKGVTI